MQRLSQMIQYRAFRAAAAKSQSQRLTMSWAEFLQSKSNLDPRKIGLWATPYASAEVGYSSGTVNLMLSKTQPAKRAPYRP